MKLKYEIKLMLSPTPTHTREICMCGTHNGYLALPEGHPWFGMDYNKIPADVHGGLTYGALQTTIYSDRSESPSMWVIGFDTCHWGDKPEVQDINFVWAELLSLHDQAQQATAVAEPEPAPVTPTKQLRLNTLEVYNMVTAHLESGLAVRNTTEREGTQDVESTHWIYLDKNTISLNTPDILDSVAVSSDYDDIFLMPDGSIDYHTPKGNPDKQGTITFLSALPVTEPEPTPKPTPVPPTKATKFYHFSQNNSGGSFVVNERVGNDVVIEAHDADHANTIAESVGIYFDGAGDCPCCGNRWSEAYEADGESFPHCDGERLETLSASYFRSEVHVYYLGSDKHEIIKLS